MNSQGIDTSRLTVLFIIVSVFFNSCIGQTSEDSLRTEIETQQLTPITSSTATAVTSTEVVPTLPDNQICQDEFIKREMREPYQRYESDARYTLSEDELRSYLDLMGIESICVPREFGLAFINVDWNSDEIPATGRMVSIGFEELYPGAGWSSAHLLYSTYDFSVGSEYDVFATSIDFERVQNNAMPNIFSADGIEGFVRFQPSLPLGLQSVMKAYIFPFETYYVAAVVELGVYDPAEVENILSEMEAGRHPDLMGEEVALIDFMVATIRFRQGASSSGQK